MQDSLHHHPLDKADDGPSLAWLLISCVGGATAASIATGTFAGRLGIPITSLLLLCGALIGAMPRLGALLARRWSARLPELVLALLAFAVVSGVGLALAWPALLPLGRSVDAVHQYQLVHWIATEQRLPPLDSDTQGLMGEMIAYPTGLAFTVVAAAALGGATPLEALFPTVAVLGGIAAALVALLAAGAGGVRGWRIVLPGLTGTLLLLAHRTYFMEAYIDHSYYAMVLGCVLVLLACAWPICEPRFSMLGALQIGLVLAALLATYPLWAPIPALFVTLALVNIPRQQGRFAVAPVGLLTRSFGQAPRLLAIAFPPLLLALVDLPARLNTGQTVLSHEGLVTQPTLFSLTPIVLAVPAAAVLCFAPTTNGRRSAEQSLVSVASGPWSVVIAALITLAALGALALAARAGLTAEYHSLKLLFVLTPLAAAVVGAAAIRLTALEQPNMRLGALALLVLTLAITSARFVLPIRAEQLPSRDLVAASNWLLANDPEAAEDAVIVGAPAGPLGYWLQVALLGQRRDRAEAAMRAFTITPPTPEGWAVDQLLPSAAVAARLGETPPGAELAARFGEVAVLRRAPVDVAATNPLVLRYDSRWEEGRLKTALEMIRPVAGPLPLIELQLYHDTTLVNTFPLPPNSERVKPQYLGADVIPETLGGEGYVNTEAYPTFAPPANAPAGSFRLLLRLSVERQTVDERLLATFNRTESGGVVDLALHSGELDYLRRPYEDTGFQGVEARFGGDVALTGWRTEAGAGEGTVAALLRWQALSDVRKQLLLELRVTDAEGNIVARSRSGPQDGFYPTWRWRTGEAVIERRVVQLPPDLPAGTYTLLVAAHDERAQEELPLTGGTARLGEVRVER